VEETKFKILPIDLLEKYCESISDSFLKIQEQLVESELSVDTFSFYTSVSAVFSS
jgi:hypothetical protein